MRIRHRIPSVFNLYMVDVLCCALGCVILVWQLDKDEIKSIQEATAKAKEEADEVLASTKQDRDALKSKSTSLEGSLNERLARIAALEEQIRKRGERIAELEDAIAASKVLLKDTQAQGEKRVSDLETLRAALAKQLATTETKLTDLELVRAALAKDLAASEKKATDLETLRAALAKELAKNETKMSDLELLRAALAKELATNQKKVIDLDGLLTNSDKKLLELAKQLSLTEKEIKDLKSLADLVPGLRTQLTTAQLRLAEQTKETDARSVKLTETNRSLEELKAARAAAELALKRKSDELALALSFENKWKLAAEKLSLLEKELSLGKSALATTANDLTALRAQKLAADSEVVRIRQAADNRFAGITLTGRRVIFLVDMSGSMVLLDDKTPAPLKWGEVRNTLLKVMKSLPDLEKFQLIVFEAHASYLLGKPDEWIDYDPKTSLTSVEEAMKALKPRGGTNMYEALDACFRYRQRGLDTIYLLSDGLPNMGDGVPEAEARRLLEMGKESELSERLARHIRRTLKVNWNREIGNEQVRINSVGFFYESPDVGAFLWALSRENNGSFVGMSRP